MTKEIQDQGQTTPARGRESTEGTRPQQLSVTTALCGYAELPKMPQISKFS